VSQKAKPYKLTDSQVSLLLNLLWDHKQTGEYWGSRMQHSKLIELTVKVLDPNEVFPWE